MAGIGAQMFAAPKGRTLTIHDHRIQDCFQLAHVMPIGPVTTSDSGTPRPSTSK